jgi:hypothetical protein
VHALQQPANLSGARADVQRASRGHGAHQVLDDGVEDGK